MEEALASVLDWMAIEHKMAVSKMPASVNKDMFTEVMAGLRLPASRAAQDAQLKAKDMGAEGQSRGRAIGRGRGKARGKGGPQGAHRKQKRQAVSPWMGSSSEDSVSSIVCKPTTMAMALTATVPQVAPLWQVLQVPRPGPCLPRPKPQRQMLQRSRPNPLQPQAALKTWSDRPKRS